MAAMQTKKEMSSQWENISCKSLVASGNQRLLNLCGAEDVLLLFQSLRFRIEIITQNRRFRKSFDKIAAFVTKIDYMPCFFCDSYPWQLRAVGNKQRRQGSFLLREDFYIFLHICRSNKRAKLSLQHILY